MEWFPIVFFTFKILALGTGMYFAIKWHYDQLNKSQRGAALRSGWKMAGAFVVLLVSVGLIAFYLSRMLGLDLGLQ
ncbi:MULTISPECIES: hypothetical protein [unclassified Rhizobium]|uniref:hypothetical protein n=1 Tax=unclassified Rhizobium TaxID=2613769 RepID=UPI001ADA5B40|nr:MULTISPECIES: hypothetical protein [unclassified Rhizobium]MBO9127957.1 hypothetical protein [Rhizobium sp. 16-488-2b]MBO9178534.1 hypothetical protein [Rhizobium sp. 16-488-2a]